MSEPTLSELLAAFNDAIISEGIAGAQAETRQILDNLRKKKTTWIGEKENNLRYVLDEYLNS